MQKVQHVLYCQVQQPPYQKPNRVSQRPCVLFRYLDEAQLKLRRSNDKSNIGKRTLRN